MPMSTDTPISVLDVDADLGRWLGAERRAQARGRLVGRPVTLEKGRWDVEPPGERPGGPGPIGLLIVEGFVARELVMDAQVSLELLGPGDLVRPWDDEGSLLPIAARWNVLSPARLVVLGSDFTRQLTAVPEVGAVLFARMHMRSQRLAETQAISHANGVAVRVHSMLWHLADRWGRVTVEGTVVPLALSHRMLGELVGARRPSVSAGLVELERSGAVVRRGDGTWLLGGSPPAARTSAPQPLVPTRRRRFESEPDAPAPDRKVA